MNIKGVIFESRKYLVIKKFGQKRWDVFYKKLSEIDSFFKKNITPISLIPFEKFNLFEKEMLKEFYGNDENKFWEIGEESANYFMQNGLYQAYIKNQTIKSFIEIYMPFLINSFFNGLKVDARYEGTIIHIKIKKGPLIQNSFEFVFMGYLKGAMTILGTIKTEVQKISESDEESYYQVFLSE